MKSFKEKWEYERRDCNKLMEAVGMPVKFVRHGDDLTEPDIIYRASDGRFLGVEMTTAYINDQYAQARWDSNMKDVAIPPIEEPDEKLCQRIQEKIIDKCSKHYTGVSEEWLCIVEDSPLSDLASMRDCLESMQIPAGNRFAAIYVLHHDTRAEGGGYQVIQLI
jgi:hypothetical protein